MPIVIGLTGSIATGKSTISAMFEEHNIPVIDADVIARHVVEPGQIAYYKIVECFGTNILDANGRLNRSKLAEVIFSDDKKRNQLNEIVHPEIRKSMIKQKEKLLAEGYPSIVMDIPLLFESKLTALVDKIVVVYVDETSQLERLKLRNGYSTEEAMKRIKSQMPIKEKVALADAIIDNSGTVEQSKKQLEKLINGWDLLGDS